MWTNRTPRDAPPARPAHVASLLLLAAALSSSCGDTGDATSAASGAGGSAASYDFGLPAGFPTPAVPADNPMSDVKVELGRRLFYDVRLSGNETQSCGSCHRQASAFTDELDTAVGSTGEMHFRSSMTITNVAYVAAFTWANPTIVSLEAQALGPMFGDMPVELGLAGREAELLARLRAEPLYQDLFPEAFPDEVDPFTVDAVTKAIAAFERTILSYRSPYDRYVYGGDPTGLSGSALRGKELFFSERLECFHCHGGFNLSGSVVHEGTTFADVSYHNTGLYNLGGTGDYPASDTGLHRVTGEASDMGRFRAPTLRNIAMTAPYMHDGSVATLSDVLDHYAVAGRTVAMGPNAGVGSESPWKSNLLIGFELTAGERADVLAFFDSLTDSDMVHDPALGDPWQTP